MRKKGFTLLELLGVIILLAVIAVIATPVVLNVVEDAKISADMSSARALLDAARLYKTEGLFDEHKKEKVDKAHNIYGEVQLLNKPEDGKLHINNKGETALAVIIRDKCFYKELEDKDIEVRQVSDCDLGWIGTDEVNPTVNQEVIQGSKNNNGWYKEDIYIKVNVIDNESGVKGYKRCIGNTECEPTSELYNSAIIITNESESNVVCVIGVDNQDNESEKNCITYKLDKTKPTIIGIENSKIELDSEIDLKNGITSEDSLSGMDGEMVITPNTIDTSKIGTTEVTYKVVDKAGNETTVNRTVEILGGAPSITFSSTGTFNSNGWARSDFYINATVTDNSTKGIKSIKWCSTTGADCIPTVESNTISAFVSQESASNKICVEAIDNNDKVTTLCSDSYKLDKTSPSIEGVNDVTIQKGNSIDLSNGVSYNDTLSGIEGSISISPSTVDTSKAGTTNVTYKVVDKAGNERSIVRKVIVDADGPLITYTVQGSPINSNGWSKSDFYVKGSITDQSGLGIKSTKWCSSTSGTCTPIADLNGTELNSLISSESNNNRICIQATDNNNKTSEVICSDTYRLDKTKPTIGGVNNIVINLGESVNLTSGISTSDNLSGISGSYSYTPTSINTNAVGNTTVTYRVSDIAGNETVVSRNVEVLGNAPSISFSSNGTFNSNGWARNDFYINASVIDNSGKGIKSSKWCSTTGSSCTPTTSSTSISAYIGSESVSNKICVEAIDNNNKVTTLCSGNYALDKTRPTIGGVNNIVINLGGSVNLTSGITTSDNLSGISGSYSYTPTSINTNVIGNTTVTYRVSDNAGNETVVSRNVEVLGNAPSIIFSSTGSFNGYGWARSDFYINASVTDNSGKGIKSSKWCSTTGSSCTPTTSSTSISAYIGSESVSNKICVEAIDNNNKVTTLCSGNHALDKTVPIAGTSSFSGTVGSNGWYTSNVSVNVGNGSDSLSGHLSTVSSVSSITYNSSGATITITTTDYAGNSASRYYTIKVDKSAPSLTAKGGTVTITQGDNYAVSNYFNAPSYSVSGGSLSCSPSNTGGLGVGNQTVSCTAIGNNGLRTSATKTITVKSRIYVDNSGANNPMLLTNMIPIRYTGSSWVYADTSQAWYNYNNKEWANAVILRSGVSKSVGQTISESDIALWYVWLPRYKYTIFNGNNGSVSLQQINVMFESGTATTGTVRCTDAVTGYNGNSSENCSDTIYGSIINGTSTYTHPAFTFGGKQLTGVWIGKFENSGTTSNMTIVPNKEGLRKNSVSEYFNASKNLKTLYGINNGDSHMIKSMEWGAIAYLKQSQYGLGTTQMGINNNTKFITGCGASLGSSLSSTCNAYNTTEGKKASTTGNVYGIYDMSGGAREYVMGNMVGYNGTFRSNGDGFSSAPDAKYYDSYTHNSSATSHSRGKLGDATKEILGTYGSVVGTWYRGRSSLLYIGVEYGEGVWMLRGRDNMFDFDSLNGAGNGTAYGSRSTLVEY